MPNMMIKRIGEDAYATTMVILHPDRDVSSPLVPRQVVEVTDEDWAFFKDHLPFTVELTDDPPTRKAFDRTSLGEEPFTYFSVPQPEAVARPQFTPAQQAEVDRQLAEREAQLRADNPNWIDPATIPSPDASGTSELTAAEKRALTKAAAAKDKKAEEK